MLVVDEWGEGGGGWANNRFNLPKDPDAISRCFSDSGLVSMLNNLFVKSHIQHLYCPMSWRQLVLLGLKLHKCKGSIGHPISVSDLGHMFSPQLVGACAEAVKHRSMC